MKTKLCPCHTLPTSASNHAKGIFLQHDLLKDLLGMQTTGRRDMRAHSLFFGVFSPHFPDEGEIQETLESVLT